MAEADPMRPVTAPLRTMDLVRDRAVEAVLSRSGINHPALVDEIRRQFGSTKVEDGALVREPVIEGAAPFVTDGRTFADCSGNLLHPEVIRAISSDTAGEYRFPPDAQPYRHQVEAWRHLTDEQRNSVLVTSGTGSGKTECFLMPLLHDLATESDAKGRLSGVRAIALYPLNALIASQKERLRAWTRPFGGKVRFGLYNGLTPDKLRASDMRHAEQAQDRETLRRDPPPILVTNVTMLEYMTIRRIDRPLIENSRGQLRWIILDEAHGYVGSAAAEIALLIRRVLLAFGVKASDVRFVATSATIGDGKDVTDDLRRFLQDISGAEADRIHVVTGAREPLMLPKADAEARAEPTLLADRDRLRANPAVQSFLREAEAGVVPLAKANSLLAPTGLPVPEILSAIADDGDRQRDPILPLRFHGFLRAVPGLWSCINPDCGKSPEGWPFGAVLPERSECCPSCSAPVLEINACRECGEPWLDCEERDGHLQPRYTPPVIDEFAALRDRESSEDMDNAPDPAREQGPIRPLYDGVRLAVGTRALDGCHQAHIDPKTGQRFDRAEEGTIVFHTHSPESCGACEASEGRLGDVLRPFRFGAPFLIGSAAPVMLEGVPRRPVNPQDKFAPPAEGRQLLSFTDSRQGTARFAANLQTNSERSFVRGHLYHAVQGSIAMSSEGDADVTALRSELAALEQAAAASPGILDELIAEKKRQLAAKLSPSLDGLSWPKMRERLAETEVVRKWMSEVWRLRDDRFGKDGAAFAEFLLMREFMRRPRRANTAETLGLARLRFDTIDRIATVPEVLRNNGRTIEDWHGLLYCMVDMVARANLAVRVLDADLHWITRLGWRKALLPFGEKKVAQNEVAWPVAGVAHASNLVMALEKALQMDRTDGADRAALNELLADAWAALSPLFYDPSRPGHALDFDKAHLAPVSQAWLCPVTGRVLPHTVLGLSPYGHREGVKPADKLATAITFPRLPMTFPRGNSLELIRAWLDDEPGVAELRKNGVWTNLNDQAALLAPYIRSAEHSAQQPAERLRRFEREFKDGEINILNCSTTMEMGVDIGSVSTVMMTNVPPALANYRQRVGRAGRRRQGFASSLTYTRDTPLEREAFAAPEIYLARSTRAPRVKLDSRRIVQRHVNALLLARWFAGEGGEALKVQVGDFFGCPQGIGAARPDVIPAEACLNWLDAPSTQTNLAADVAQLLHGTVLEGDATVFTAAREALDQARNGVVGEWDAMQAQAANAPPEGRGSIAYQLERLTKENLLSELASRNILPGHGLPTGVVQFVNADKAAADESDRTGDGSRGRRSFPSRTLDIAIRDYAPGAEVVVNGLVYSSAGVTLNWRRPADDAKASEIQSIKVFWTCVACGAADCSHVAPLQCPTCRSAIPLEAQRRFLAPSGFTVDMGEQPHADTDEVTYVEPEPEQIVARGAAWGAMANPLQGRLRASGEGLVFYSSRGGAGRLGYHVCMECGRAEPAAADGDGGAPMRDHQPLRGTQRNAAGVCPGTEKSFKITPPIALGCETLTDVAELQPANLASEGAALALVSALREALARRLGVEQGEMGLAIRRARGPLGQSTHSLFLFDRASGGAGFAPQAVALWELLLADARKILDCKEPGCVTGCSACVLTGDLHRQQEKVDRRVALDWAIEAIALGGSVDAEDLAHPAAILCRSVSDAVLSAVDQGARNLAIWCPPNTDAAGLADPWFSRFLRRLAERGVRIRLIVATKWLDQLDPASRLAVRDAVKAIGAELKTGDAPRFANGAVAIAAIDEAGGTSWASRDIGVAMPGEGWGQPQEVPIVAFPSERLPLGAAIDLERLLPPSSTAYVEIAKELDGPIAEFGKQFAALLVPKIRAAGGAGALQRVSYNDRYLQSPLTIRLMADGLASLCARLDAAQEGLPLTITTNRFKPNQRQPYSPEHDWEWEDDRRDILEDLMGRRGFDCDLDEGRAAHARTITLNFEAGKTVRVVLDQGFGPWRAPNFARFDFSDPADRQADKLDQYSVMIANRGASYAVVTNPAV